jgi:hypothetical protein
MPGLNCVAATAGGVEVAEWIIPNAFPSKYSFLQVSSLIETVFLLDAGCLIAFADHGIQNVTYVMIG